MPAREHHLRVSRTARYYTLGDAAAARQVWFVLHGYGQLAAYFIRHFAPLDDGSRLIVAPEGLSRFYLERTTWRSAGEARVAASWMTREDRDHEIADYVSYLDQVYQRVMAERTRDQAHVVVLGFSQAVATACRWVGKGSARADTLVMWAGPLPPDLDAAATQRLLALKVIRVLGDQDDMAAPDVVVAEEASLRELGISAELVRFRGGHELDAGVLKSLPV